MISGVEKSWRGKKVILDPGSGGNLGIANRIRALRGKNSGGQNVMIDYAKYNTQHSLNSQKIVIAAVCEKIGYPKGMADKLVASIDKHELFVQGEYLGTAKGTLLSGHRLTTFINSVLNLAYLKVFCKSIDKCLSMHVGDDIYVTSPDLDSAATLMMEVKLSPIRAKAEKQSMGEHSAEFLRMCSRGKVTRGYPCRSISSCIMGNWVSDMRLDPQEALQTMVGTSWTLVNRAEHLPMGDLLVASVCRMTGINGNDVRALLRGEAALNDGPQRYSGSHAHYVRVEFTSTGKVRSTEKYRARATKSYCENHITPIEIEAIELSGASVVGAMKDASYMKSYVDPSAANVRDEVSHVAVRDFKGLRSRCFLEDLEYSKAPPGLLSGYPILNLIKNQLSHEVLGVIMTDLGADLSGRESEEELYFRAWGRKEKGSVIVGFLPYSEAAAFSGITDRDVIYCGEKYLFV
jgi:hypothetical protein